MAKLPKKVAVIGLDCALPHLIKKHIQEGYLPTFKMLIEKGCLAENCLAPYPTVTPPNWAALATGAFAGTHGITDFHGHRPGDQLDNTFITQNWSSDRFQAETIWEAAERAGKKSIIFTYPGSWPSKIKNGIVVGGSGMTVAEDRTDQPNLDKDFFLCTDFLITTDYFPNAVHGEFEEADEWENVDELGEEPLEMEAKLNFPMAAERPADASWYVLARQMGGEGYDTVTLSPSKDFAQAFCTLKVGEWSPKISTGIKMPDGSERHVFFKTKLMKLDPEGEEITMLVSALADNEIWTYPAEIAKEFKDAEGCIHFSGGMVMAMLKQVDLDTYVEMNDNLSTWNGNAVSTLLKNHEWDLFYMHSHPIDWMYHVLISQLDSEDEAVRNKAWEVHRKMYEVEDRMLAKILEVIDKDTLVCVVSDHGATPDGPTFDPYKALVPAGLSVLKEAEAESDGTDMRRRVLSLSTSIPDYSKAKAIPQREIYIYINLKGRDPEGIVEPEDYEKVQQQIIDSLLTYVDPGTGMRPVALALSKKDARIIGLHGDRIGDVVYAVYPWFGAQHGQILPTGEFKSGSLKPLMLFYGPGVKKGHVMERTCWLTDLVPTICYLADFPMPNEVEGAVLFQAFKDPDFKQKEMQKLKEGLARMEAAMQRESREPWDHHDCA